jgi:hypothetical protein
MAPSRRPSAPQRSSWTMLESATARAQRRVLTPAVEAAVAVRRVWPPASRRPLLEKVAAGWSRACGEAPRTGERRGEQRATQWNLPRRFMV